MSNLTKDPNDQVNELNKTERKKQNKPMIVHKGNKSNIDINPFKKINTSIIKKETNNKKPKISHHSSIEIKQEKHEKKIKDSGYNSTINFPLQNFPTITNNMINKKPNSSNKLDVIYYVKSSNNAHQRALREFNGIKNDNAKTFEIMVNNLQIYIPKNDLNMNENNNFYKKKK